MDLRKYLPGLRGDSIDGEIIDADTIAAGDIAAGAVGDVELAAAALSATALGRAIMANGYFDLATHALKVAAGAIATASLADGILSAAVAGRAKVAAGFFDVATVLDKFAAGSFTAANVLALFAANSFDAANVADAFATNSFDVANVADIIQNASITAAKLAADVVATVAIVTLTNAQVLNLRATPIEVIANPGVGKSVVVLRLAVKSDSAAGAWTEPDVNNIALEYSGGTDIEVIEATGLVTTGDIQYRTQAPAVAVATPVSNQSVQLFQVGAAEFGGGNAANTLRVHVAYLVLG